MNRIKQYIAHALQTVYSSGEVKGLSRIICSEILELPDSDIYSYKDINLSPKKEKLLREVIGRLLHHEPIQYILGYTRFCGLDFQVTRGVLIPRPETEEMVELILKENPGKPTILDMGTGGGCIAISLSKKLPAGKVEGWDISEEALKIARLNNEKLKTTVSFHQADMLKNVDRSVSYDLIVSNPPYVTHKEKETMDKNVLNWEPATALFVPDTDPLIFYRHIAAFGKNHLNPAGKLYLEINPTYGTEIAGMLEETDYTEIKIIKDLSGKNRIISARR